MDEKNSRTEKGRNYVFGRAGEEEACKYLMGKGMQILERNFRCKLGEIDIIARDGETLVFAEVKTRRSHKYGSPLLAITPGKMRHMALAAEYYLKTHRYGRRTGNCRGFSQPKCRVDAIGVVLGRGWIPEEGICGELEISHIPGIRIEAW